MSVIKIQLIVVTYHMCSREQIPQEPKSMISLNHPAPAVSQDTLVQQYCSSPWAALPRLYLGLDQKSECGRCAADGFVWLPFRFNTMDSSQNMHVVVMELSKYNFQFSVVV